MENDLWMDRDKRRKASGPDGKEAWLVALAACFINFITAGIGRSSGILYINFIDIFHIDRKQASYPITTRSFTRNLLGPLVGILGQKYGVRCIIIIGGIISTLSAAACFFAEDIFWITILWGGFNGLGIAMITTLFQVSISEHFVKHKSVAAGMGFSGGCVGSFLFPGVLDNLIYEYGLQGTFLMVAGILMQSIPASMILKKPTWMAKKKSIVTSELHADCDTSMLPDMSKYEKSAKESDETLVNEMEPLKPNKYSMSTQFISNEGTALDYQGNANGNFQNRNVDTEFLWENRRLAIRLLTDDFTLQCPLLSSSEFEPILTDVNINQIKDLFVKIATDTQVEMLTSDKDYNQSNNSPQDSNFIPCENGSPPLQMTDFSQFKRNPLDCLLFFLKQLFERDKEDIIVSQSEDARSVVSEILNELWYIQALLEKYKNRNGCITIVSNSMATRKAPSLENNSEHANTIYSHIKTALKLYTKPVFILTSCCRSSHFFSFVPIVTVIVDYSRDKGISEDYGVYILAALSAGDLIGRLFFGMITDRGFISLSKYMFLFMILCGISTVMLKFANSMLSLTIALIIYGLLQGSTFLQHPVIISKYLESHEQSIALGCLNFFSGILAFLLPSYIGFFRDYLGSYDGMLYISGGISALVGSLWFFDSFFLKVAEPRSRLDQETNV